MKTLFIIRGCSGAGKTTLAKHLAKIYLAADDYFTDVHGNYNFDASKLGVAHEQCQNRTKLYMTSGVDVAVHNTFTTEKEMKPYLDLAEEYGYKVVSLIVEHRHDGNNVHNVPEEVLIKQEARLRQNIKLTNLT